MLMQSFVSNKDQPSGCSTQSAAALGSIDWPTGSRNYTMCYFR